MPTLETARLLIRPLRLCDLEAIHQLLDVDLRDADFGSESAHSLADRKQWLEWTLLNNQQLAQLYQPPYGDRAIVLRETGGVIGAVGFVPCLAPFEQLPGFSQAQPGRRQPSTPELGLFYAVAPAFQRRGFAAEAARAMCAYAFGELGLKRIVATTTRDNKASMGVMRRLGMRLAHNPLPDPPWFQVAGWLDNDRWPHGAT